jgi:hypothetical protein
MRGPGSAATVACLVPRSLRRSLRHAALAGACAAAGAALLAPTAVAETSSTPSTSSLSWYSNIASVVQSGRTLYVGGTAGFVRNGDPNAVVAIDLDTGQSVPGWTAALPSTAIVTRLLLHDGRIYVAGTGLGLTCTGSQIVAIEPVGSAGAGTRTAFGACVHQSAGGNTAIDALAASPGTLYVGGTNADVWTGPTTTLTRRGVAALDDVTGEPLPAFNARIDNGRDVFALDVAAGKLFAGGNLYGLAGVTTPYEQLLVALDTTTGASLSASIGGLVPGQSNPSADGPFVGTIAHIGTQLYYGGSGLLNTTPAGYGSGNLGSLDAGTFVHAKFADLNTRVPDAMSATSHSLVVGGEFQKVLVPNGAGGTASYARQQLFEWDPVVGSPTAFGPNVGPRYADLGDNPDQLPSNVPVVSAGEDGTVVIAGAFQNAPNWPAATRPTYSFFEVFGTTPSLRSAPAVTGTAAAGQVVSCDGAAFDGGGYATLAYAWKRGAATITGATDRAYKVTAADAGADLSCTTTFTSDYGTSTGASAVVAIPGGGTPAGGDDSGAGGLTVGTNAGGTGVAGVGSTGPAGGGSTPGTGGTVVAPPPTTAPIRVAKPKVTRSRLTASVTVPEAGRLTATLTAGKKRLGTAAGVTNAKGRVTLTVKLKHKLPKGKASLVVTFTPFGGGPAARGTATVTTKKATR